MVAPVIPGRGSTDFRNMCESFDADKELELLKCGLKQTQDKVRLWSQEEIPFLVSNHKVRHDSNVKDINDEIQKYSNFLSKEQKEIDMVDKKMIELCNQLEQLKKELTQLSELSQELRLQTAKQDSSIENVKQEMEKVKTDILSSSERQHKIDYLHKANQCFGSRLGLEFKKTRGNRIQVIFTQVDERDPLKVFYFFLQIEGPGRKYVVSDTSPEIDVNDIVTELNQSNNLRKFMITIRNRFKSTLENK
ncbi:kinetochore-associated Ndc80 complex subunit spc25 [Mactra antiquata]